MKKFQVIIHYTMDDDFMSFLPGHRELMARLIDRIIIDSYMVSIESRTVWATFNAATKEEVMSHLRKSPLYKYWNYSIEELLIFDGHLYRLPTFQLN